MDEPSDRTTRVGMLRQERNKPVSRGASPSSYSDDAQCATLTPLTILVYDDFAVINFYVRGLLQEPGGVPTFTTIRWLNVWKKENGG
ncbi:MAG: hypothetical protein JSW71_12780 [Gemmatimonadota bacterium]|nr:MAG: hypothetical protein JSW71_12780 [Gemmatimonadota bacterium]